MHRLQVQKFSKWASSNGLSDNDLNVALDEIENGLHNGKLGGHLYKKRVSIDSKGKRGGGRTIVCYKRGDRVIFLHGFKKNETDNIPKKELEAFKQLAKELVKLSEEQIETAIRSGAFKEI